MNAKFDRQLRHHQLLPNTKEQYRRIVARMDGEDPVSWLNRKVNARTPVGTVLPLRAAVKHLLLSEGYKPSAIEAMLPKAKGRPPREPDTLSVEQLALFYAAVSEINEPHSTLLSLLPRTGLRISEACNMHIKNLVKRHGHFGFHFRGKRDKARYVPLNRPARLALKRYLQAHPTETWLFKGRGNGPIGPAAVRKVCRQLRKRHPELGKFTPHTLRHTFATNAIRKGVDVATLQALMGHESIQTTQRYLHPDAGMLSDAVEALE